jgi:hypothetical protein
MMETIKFYIGKYPAKAKREVPKGRHIRSYNAGKQKAGEVEQDFIKRIKEKFSGCQIEYLVWDNDKKSWMPQTQPNIQICEKAKKSGIK